MDPLIAQGPVELTKDLADLPRNVLEHVASFVTTKKEAVAFAGTCKRLRQIIIPICARTAIKSPYQRGGAPEMYFYRTKPHVAIQVANAGWLQHMEKVSWQSGSEDKLAEQVQAVVLGCPVLKSLGFGQMTLNGTFSLLETFPAPPSFVPNVETVSFYRCTIGDETLEQMLQVFPRLRNVELNKSYGFAWTTLDYIEHYVSSIYHYTNSDDWDIRWTDKSKEFRIGGFLEAEKRWEQEQYGD